MVFNSFHFLIKYLPLYLAVYNVSPKQYRSLALCASSLVFYIIGVWSKPWCVVLLLGLTLLCTAFGFTMQPVAQKPISSETAGIIGALNPLTTAILGWLLLGEMLGASGILGAVLIISGILLPNLRVGSKSVCGNDAQ